MLIIIKFIYYNNFNKIARCPRFIFSIVKRRRLKTAAPIWIHISRPLSPILEWELSIYFWHVPLLRKYLSHPPVNSTQISTLPMYLFMWNIIWCVHYFDMCPAKTHISVAPYQFILLVRPSTLGPTHNSLFSKEVFHFFLVTYFLQCN